MIIHGDVAFMILSTVLVLIMTPGLAFFYGGLVERKNALTIMFQVFIAIFLAVNFDTILCPDNESLSFIVLNIILC